MSKLTDSILSLGLMQILRHSRSPLAVSGRSVPASEEFRSLLSSTLPSRSWVPPLPVWELHPQPSQTLFSQHALLFLRGFHRD